MITGSMQQRDALGLVSLVAGVTADIAGKTRETKNGLLICFGLLCFFLGLFGFLAWLLVNSPSPRH